jgi:putative ABC transport system permease protein
LTSSRGHRRVRFVLIGAETLLAVVLLTSGGLLASAFDQSTRVDPGFDPQHVLGAQVRLPTSAYPTPESRWQFVKTVLARIRATPGVIDASTTHNMFIPGFAFITLVNIEGKPTPDGQAYTVQFRRVSPGYFRTMRIAELRGRSFDDHDDPQATPVAIVSRGFAEQFWPGEEALGRRLQRTADLSKWFTVVGVVEDVRDVSLTQAPSPTLYIPFAQNNVATASVGLVVRTAGQPLAASKAVSQAVHEVDPAQPLSNVTTVDGFLQDSLGAGRFRSVVLVVFAALGLLLASVGIYGVTARGVAERTRELGVRLALGGEPWRIRRLVLARSLAGVAAGFAAGLPAALLTAAALKQWLPGVETARPAAAILAQAGLVAAGLIAAGVPALRAGRVDPLVALRE